MSKVIYKFPLQNMLTQELIVPGGSDWNVLCVDARGEDGKKGFWVWAEVDESADPKPVGIRIYGTGTLFFPDDEERRDYLGTINLGKQGGVWHIYHVPTEVELAEIRDAEELLEAITSGDALGVFSKLLVDKVQETTGITSGVGVFEMTPDGPRLVAGEVGPEGQASMERFFSAVQQHEAHQHDDEVAEATVTD